METTTKRVKRQVIEINDVNDLRKLLKKAMEHKGYSKYKVYRALDILPMTLKNILNESDKGFNVNFLIGIMKILDIKFVIEVEQDNILDKS